MNARPTIAVFALVIGCGFSAQGNDVAGLGQTSGAMQAAETAAGESPGEADGAGADTSDPDTGESDGVGSVTSPDSGPGESTGMPPGDGGESGGESGQVDMCGDPPFYKEIIDAEDALLSSPMMLWTPAGDEAFVATLEDDAGVASFVWDAPCNDVYRLWVRVWDQTPGPLEDGPDSLQVGLAGGASSTWLYGCQTGTTFSGDWHWLRVQSSLLCVFEEDAIEFSVGAGPHAFVFNGLEGGTFNAADPPGELAAISRILVTNDPSYVPGADD